MPIVRGNTLINNAVSIANQCFCVGTLKFETRTILSPKYNIFESRGLAVWGFECSAVCPSGYVSPGELSCIYNWLFAGARHFLPVAELFVIAIENILLGVCGQFNKRTL